MSMLPSVPSSQSAFSAYEMSTTPKKNKVSKDSKKIRPKSVSATAKPSSLSEEAERIKEENKRFSREMVQQQGLHVPKSKNKKRKDRGREADVNKSTKSSKETNGKSTPPSATKEMKRKTPSVSDHSGNRKGKKQKRRNGVEEDSLNGDDIPLCEEVMGGMWNEENGDQDDNSDKTKSSAINGDNFYGAVTNSNVEMIKKSKASADARAKKKAAKRGDVEEENEEEIFQAEEEAEFSKSLRKSFAEKADKKSLKRKGSDERAETKKRRKGRKETVEEEDEDEVNSSTASSSTTSSAPVKPLGKLEAGSAEVGRSRFEWIIHPVKADQFFADSFEKRPLHIKRSQKNYYKEVFSTKEFDDILRRQRVLFGKNLDVTSYSVKEGRETHNPVGVAHAPVVWDFYNNGCSLRMINPQTFSEGVWKECAVLQEFLGSMVGANVYLTPPGTQGFAPHYDDVEVFILQLEGKKHWRLYEPRNKQEELPRYSSANFAQSEIGQPCLDVILEAGDLLYFPRGTIHQGDCLPDAHSLHVTISCHQLNSYGDLLERLLPAALKSACAEDVEFRRGLPTDYMSFTGQARRPASAGGKNAARAAFIDKVKELAGKVFDYASVDKACDEMGKRFLHDSLPPYLTPREASRTVEADGEKWHAGLGKVVNRVEIDPDTEVRLVRANCVRLVTEGDVVRIYHNVENTREYHEAEEEFLEVDPELAPAAEALVRAYPSFVRAEELPLPGLDERMRVVQDLWERKLLMTRDPLESHYDD